MEAYDFPKSFNFVGFSCWAQAQKAYLGPGPNQHNQKQLGATKCDLM